MLTLPITGLTAALATILLVVLSFNVSLGRMKGGVDHGDGGDAALLRRIRAQGNFIEYVPLGLILMALAEMNGASAALLWAMAALLLLGRVAHAMGTLAGKLPGRAAGMLMTYAALLIGAGSLLLAFFA